MPILIILFTLFVIGVYTLTDSARLSHDPLLHAGDWTGYAFCHRITDRSFEIGGRQVPLCARCTGMYLGVALSFLLLALAGRLRRVGLPPWPILLLLFGFIAIMGIDGLNSYSHFFPGAPHIYEPRNWLRLLTGLGTGLAMGIILLPTLAHSLWQSPEYLPAIGRAKELMQLLLLTAVVFILVLSNQPHLLYVLTVMSVGGLLLIVTALNTVVLLTVLRRSQRAATWRHTVWPLLCGLALSVAEISIISTARFSLTGTMTGFPGL